jgi:hypothetical protein
MAVNKYLGEKNMALDFTLRTAWKFQTSEEKSATVGFSGATGALYFVNEDTKEKMKIRYRAFSIGAGKGPSYGASWSSTTDPSGAFDNVAVVKGRYFGPLSFPCRGYILGFGASATLAPKVIGASDQTSAGVTIILFGMFPAFAGLKLWGLANSIMPGVGGSAGIATFINDDNF